jgi:hypothetical protein
MKTSVTPAKLFFLSLSILLSAGITSTVQGQETVYKRTSIKAGAGVGINAGQRETGVGMVYSAGVQRSYGENQRLRIHPNVLFGSFRTYTFPTDTRDQLYKITSLELTVHYDLIKKDAGSLVISCGGSTHYSRGLLGTGGMPEENNNSSEYFHSLYFGVNASLGIRIDPKKTRLAYEIRPVNLSFGNKGFILGYLMFGIEYKFKEMR